MTGYITMPDNVRLYYETSGDGPQQVLIPNGFYMRRDFGPLEAGRTLIYYDVRNRGLSDAVPGNIETDANDMDAVRRHFKIDRVNLIGHSYVGLIVALYAIRYPAQTGRIVMIGPSPLDMNRQYPPDMTNTDGVVAVVMEKLRNLVRSSDPEEACWQFWEVLRPIYVADPAFAEKIDWGRCDLPNERNAMKYYMEHILPSLRKLSVTDEMLASAKAPVLVVHGRKDRSSPYGAGRDWALQLPNARLVTVENAAHAPWIESPKLVFDGMAAFLDGSWPIYAAWAS